MGIRPDDWQIGAIPVSHSYALGNIVAPLLLQGTAVVLRDTFVPAQILDDAVRVGARIFAGVPFMFDRLVACSATAGPGRRRCETLISAGAPLDRATARAFAAHTGRRIHSLYGTSETGGIAYDAEPDPDGDVTMGRPVPGVTLAFWPDEAAPPGTGRIHVTGPAVSSGYAAGADDAAFVGGGFLTGDLGAFGADGRLRLTGRVSAFVNVAGRKVQPDEVERVLRRIRWSPTPASSACRTRAVVSSSRPASSRATAASGWSRCGRSAPSGWRRTRFRACSCWSPSCRATSEAR